MRKSGDPTEDTSTDTTQKTQEDAETNKEGPSAKRVEVQFLDPVVAGEGVLSTVRDEHAKPGGYSS